MIDLFKLFPSPAHVSGAPSAEMLELAESAVKRCEARKDEDVQVWAWRLAQDIADATD